MKTLLATEKGITLVELLVALALISIVAAGLISVYWIGASAYNRENLQVDAQYDARVAMDKISSDIRECEAVEVKDAGGVEVTDGTPGPQLYLEKKEKVVGNANEIKVYITYKAGTNKILYRKRKPEKDKLVSTPITVNSVSVAFTDKGSGLIEITLKILDNKENTLFELNNRCQRRVH